MLKHRNLGECYTHYISELNELLYDKLTICWSPCIWESMGESVLKDSSLSMRAILNNLLTRQQNLRSNCKLHVCIGYLYGFNVLSLYLFYKSVGLEFYPYSLNRIPEFLLLVYKCVDIIIDSKLHALRTTENWCLPPFIALILEIPGSILSLKQTRVRRIETTSMENDRCKELSLHAWSVKEDISFYLGC